MIYKKGILFCYQKYFLLFFPNNMYISNDYKVIL